MDSIVGSYSATVGGNHYSGDVTKSGDEYTAAVSGLTGASVTASSESAAEDALTSIISMIA